MRIKEDAEEANNGEYEGQTRNKKGNVEVIRRKFLLLSLSHTFRHVRMQQASKQQSKQQ